MFMPAGNYMRSNNRTFTYRSWPLLHEGGCLPRAKKSLAAFAARHLGVSGEAYLLLLLALDFFSPAWLLRLLLLPPPRLALARSLCALLFWLLAFAPLPAASERLLLPLLLLLVEGEDLELRDAIDGSPS
jgi:hypothetical protein